MLGSSVEANIEDDQTHDTTPTRESYLATRENQLRLETKAETLIALVEVQSHDL